MKSPGQSHDRCQYQYHWLERLVSEMTYGVLMWTLSPYSLTHSLYDVVVVIVITSLSWTCLQRQSPVNKRQPIRSHRCLVSEPACWHYWQRCEENGEIFSSLLNTILIRHVQSMCCWDNLSVNNCKCTNSNSTPSSAVIEMRVAGLLIRIAMKMSEFTRWQYACVESCDGIIAGGHKLHFLNSRPQFITQ